MSQIVQTASGRLADPLVEYVFQAGSRAWYASVLKWRRNRASNGVAKRAMYFLDTSLSNLAKTSSINTSQSSAVSKTSYFSTIEFEKKAKTLYEQVIETISSKSIRELKQLKVKNILTNACYDTILNGMKISAKESPQSSYKQGVKIHQFIEPPNAVWFRPLYVNGNPLQADFIQVTVRFVTIQEPIGSLLTNDEKKELLSSTPSSIASKDSSILQGEWRPVEDNESGQVYWYNTVNPSASASWNKPSSASILVREPFRIETCGCIRDPIIGDPASPSTMRVVHHVVFERPLLSGSPNGVDNWSIAKM
jgi:hypothetical protein